MRVKRDESRERNVNSFTIKHNTENLRYIYVHSGAGAYDVTLDISKRVPENLCVFDVWIRGNKKHKYGIITSDKNKRNLNKLKQ